ncbi:MAG: DUF1353 domain-containing protein [Lentisphaeria bacterium]|nr:DUF1353 domain-containing protein [Lentisphaeria bacterium]
MKFYKTKPCFEIIEQTPDGDVIRLKRKMEYYIGDTTIEVSKGFECDGASVPRILWSMVSPTIHPVTIASSILHDYLYRKHPKNITRCEADAIFYAICRADGLSLLRAVLAWLGVRLFGGKAWKEGGQ